MSQPFRIALLVSGRGSNMRSVIQGIQDGAVHAEAAVVISNKETAPALEFARDAGIPTVVVDHRPFAKDRKSFEEVIDRALRDHGVDLVVLAGFMRILSPWFVGRWPLKIVNIHPSLLPAFPGIDAHQQALDSGAKVSGCTVHFVDDGTDTGPIIAQAAVPVLDDDTESSLAARVLAQEHRLLPQAIHQIATGQVTICGRHVRTIKRG
jgi:phosphoribosylglycinamide formyltransferase-1